MSASTHNRHDVAIDGFRHELQSRISDADDLPAAIDAACELLGMALAADRVVFVSVADGVAQVRGGFYPGLSPVTTTLPVADLVAWLDAAAPEGTTLAVSDLHAKREILDVVNPQFPASDVRGVAFFPLRRRGRIVAVVSVHTHSPHDWTADELARIELTAERIWLAHESDRADHALLESTNSAAAFADAIAAYRQLLAERLTQRGTDQSTASVACDVLGRHLGADRVAFTEIIDETWAVQRDGYAHDSIAPVQTSQVAPFRDELRNRFRQQRPFVLDDVATATDIADTLRATWLANGCAATISTGLVRNDRWVANLGVHSAVPRHWQPIYVVLTELTADRIWLSVEQTRTEELERGAADARNAAMTAAQLEIHTRSAIDAVTQFAAFLAGPTAPADIYADLATHARDAIGVVGASVLLPDGDQLRAVAAVPYTGTTAIGPEPLPRRGAHMACWRNGTVVAVDDMNLAEPDMAGIPDQYQRRAALFVPLQRGTETIGVLSVSDAVPRPWSETDIATLNLLASMAVAHLAHTGRTAVAETEAAQLRTALESRVVIEQANGMLAAEHQISVNDAFNLLRGHARRNRIALRDVADAVVHGARPGELRANH